MRRSNRAAANSIDFSVPPAGAAPVRINSAQTERPYDGYADFKYPRVTIEYTNLSAIPVETIVLGVRDLGDLLIDQFQDVGTFTQGSTIRHNFLTIDIAPSQSVDAERATFADGSVWHQGDANPLSRRQAGDLSF